jgi:hypothetical protein
MEHHLTHAHQHTYDAVFRHPAARNLPWQEVRSLLTALADDVVEEPNGNLKVSRGGQTLVLHPERTKDVADVDDLMEIRHFLQRSAAGAAAAPAEPGAAAGMHLLVVIDHREARVYRAELRGSVPERIVPYDPHGAGRYLHYVQDDDTSGQRKPEPREFYEAIARAIRGAEKVLLFGGGTGASSAMDQLVAQLERHHPDLAGRIAGAVVVDERHLTEGQLLAQARQFYAGGAPS